MKLIAKCHCGAVQLQVPRKPERLTSCNCSICHKLGAQWAYYLESEVQISDPDLQISGYMHGDRCISFNHCSRCGVPTHWSSVESGPEAKIAVNARLFEPEDIADVPIRRFDGRDTWTFLEEA